MRLFDFILGTAIINSATKHHKNNSSRTYGYNDSFERGYEDGYEDICYEKDSFDSAEYDDNNRDLCGNGVGDYGCSCDDRGDDW